MGRPKKIITQDTETSFSEIKTVMAGENPPAIVELKVKPIQKLDGKVICRVKNPKRAGIWTFSAYLDRDTNKVVQLKYANGEDRIFKLDANARPVFELNLSNPDDKVLHDFLKNDPIFVKRPEPLMTIEDVDEQSKKKVNIEDLVLQAKNEINSLSVNASSIGSFARTVGIQTHNVSANTVKLALYELATNKPQFVIDELNHKDREIKELLMDGKKNGVFDVDRQGVWRYNAIVIGATFAHAIEWIKDDKNLTLMPTIRREVNKI